MRTSIFATLVLIGLAALAVPPKETPESKPGDICTARKGPHPKKDVEIQPVCEETPTPAPTEQPKSRKVEK